MDFSASPQTIPLLFKDPRRWWVGNRQEDGLQRLPLSNMSSIGIIGPVPRVNPQAFMGIFWGGVSVTGVFLIGRGYARISTFGRLLLDDYLVLLAWLMFLVSACIWHFQVEIGWEAELFAAGSPLPGYILHFDEIIYWAHWSLSSLILYYQIIYCIKASFLVFFWRLGDRIKRYRIHWWIVAVLTMLSWLTAFGTKPYYCFTNMSLEKINWCLSPEQSQYDYNLLYIDLALNLLTDVLIVSLPLNILWKVKISLHQKLALSGIFLLTLLTMLFDIIRVTIVSVHSVQIDQMWLHVWGAMTSAVAIVVACLVSFRVFFTKTTGNASRRFLWFEGGKLSLTLSNTKSWFSSTTFKSSRSQNHEPSLSTLRSRTAGPGRRFERVSLNLPALDGIYVSKSFQATTEPRDVHLQKFKHDGFLKIVSVC